MLDHDSDLQAAQPANSLEVCEWHGHEHCMTIETASTVGCLCCMGGLPIWPYAGAFLLQSHFGAPKANKCKKHHEELPSLQTGKQVFASGSSGMGPCTLLAAGGPQLESVHGSGSASDTAR